MRRQTSSVSHCVPTLPDAAEAEVEQPMRANNDADETAGLDGEVAQKPRGRTDPGMPTPDEVKRHKLTHQPYRKLCRFGDGTQAERWSLQTSSLFQSQPVAGCRLLFRAQSLRPGPFGPYGMPTVSVHGNLRYSM